MDRKMRALLVGVAILLAPMGLTACKGDPHTGVVLQKYAPSGSNGNCYQVSLQVAKADPNKSLEEQPGIIKTICISKSEWDSISEGDTATVTEN